MPTGALGSAGERRSLRLAPSDRLRKRFEFRRVRDLGRRVHTPSFVLLVASREQPEARLGVTVSKQVGKAVRRNRVKRLVREVFRQHRELFPDGTDVVVIAKTGCAVRGYDDVLREFEGARHALRKKASQTGTTRGGSR